MEEQKISWGWGVVFTANASITPALNPGRALLPDAIVSPPTHCQATTVVCNGPKLCPDPVILESHPLKSRKLADGIQYRGIMVLGRVEDLSWVVRLEPGMKGL